MLQNSVSEEVTCSWGKYAQDAKSDIERECQVPLCIPEVLNEKQEGAWRLVVTVPYVVVMLGLAVIDRCVTQGCRCGQDVNGRHVPM